MMMSGRVVLCGIAALFLSACSPQSNPASPSTIAGPVLTATQPSSSESVIPRLASGSGGGSSSGGGTGGGGAVSGGGGGSTRPCTILTMTVLNDVVNGLAVPSFWQPNQGYVAQVSGTTEKSCDTIPSATITFDDITGAPDGCQVQLTPWVNNPQYLNPKYGAKPMSRFQEAFIYWTGTDCLGKSRRIAATLTDPSVGGKTSAITIDWTP